MVRKHGLTSRGRPKSVVKTSKTRAGQGQSPHFMPGMFGKGLTTSKGFAGRFFVETGLNTGMAKAKELLAVSVGKAIEAAIRAAAIEVSSGPNIGKPISTAGRDKVLDSTFANVSAKLDGGFKNKSFSNSAVSRAGIEFKTFNQVQYLERIDFQGLMYAAFKQSESSARRGALSKLSRTTSGKYSKTPWGAEGKRKTISSMINYETVRQGNSVIMKFAPRGTGDDAQKLYAQNFGLRAATAGELVTANQNNSSMTGGLGTRTSKGGRNV